MRTGRRIAERVEILEGLEDGDKVVVRGFLGLSDGKVVTPVSKDRAPNATNQPTVEVSTESNAKPNGAQGQKQR